MKNMINTIGKKIHTLVKENTPSRHKIRQERGFTQKFTFFYISLCFLPHCCANIGRALELVLWLLAHTKKYMTPIHALICQNMSKFVFILDVSKSRCNFITLLGKYMQQKKVGWEVIFSELWFAGSRARKPQREFEGSALKLFFHVFLRHNGALIV